MALADEIDALAAESAFSGVVRIDRGDEVVVDKAYGLAHRGYEIPNKADTRFAIASGVKGLTALAVVSLVEDGTLELTTTARSILGADLPLVGDAVTVEQLLAHRSGIGDYYDEDVPGEITVRCSSYRKQLNGDLSVTCQLSFAPSPALFRHLHRGSSGGGRRR